MAATLGPYELLEKIGEGGMGVVYRARDPRLGRTVAIKILGGAARLDASQRHRFTAEARAASALDHPNIVTIHDVGEEDDTPFLVMEYVGGATLAALTEGSALPLPRTLAIARDLAAALERAHAAGIVHRDLKPSNVMLTADGRAKILDFGLAKALLEPQATSAAASAPRSAPLTAAATLTSAPATASGTVLGTPGYMAPEQAAAQPVDARADVFAFGVLLFEMLTGRRAFLRETPAASLAAVLRDELPPPSSIVPSVPLALDRVVEGCTRKDPARRIEQMADVRRMLDDVPGATEVATTAGDRRASPRIRPWLVSTAAVVTVLLGVGAYALLRGSRDAAPIERRLTIDKLTLDRGVTGTPAISPDGRLVAYASDRSGRGDLDIYVQQVATQQAIRLTDDPHHDWQPAFSPDGTRLVFRSERDGGGLYVMDALGGAQRRLVARGYSPHWTPDGTLISYIDLPDYRGFGRAPMYVVPADGGTPRQLVPGFFSTEPPFASGAVWSPDGRSFVFNGAKEREAADWWLASLDGAPPRPLAARVRLKPAAGPFSATDWTSAGLLYAGGTVMEGTSLFRVNLDSRSGAFALPPERLARDTQVILNARLSRDGLLLFQLANVTPEFITVELDPASGLPSGPPSVIPADAAAKTCVALSKDGSRIAYQIVLGGSDRPMQLRVQDLRTGKATVVVPRVKTNIALPRFTTDGRGIAYRERQGKGYVGLLMSTDGSTAREICRDCVVDDFFSDGRTFCAFEQPNRIVKKRLDGGPDELLFTFADPRDVAEGDVNDTVLSPNNRLLALELGHADGSAEIRVVRLDGAAKSDRDGAVLVRGEQTLAAPRWSADGRLLYFLSARDGSVCVWARRIDPTTGVPQGEAFPVLHRHDALSGVGVTPRSMLTIEVGRGRLVMPVPSGTSNLWKARLPD